MNRTVKLGTTLTSMILALALMTFGVYALLRKDSHEIRNDIEFVIDGEGEEKVDVIFSAQYGKLNEEIQINTEAPEITNGNAIQFNIGDAFIIDGKTYVGYIFNYRINCININEKINSFQIKIKNIDVNYDTKVYFYRVDNYVNSDKVDENYISNELKYENRTCSLLNENTFDISILKEEFCYVSFIFIHKITTIQTNYLVGGNIDFGLYEV